MTNRDYYNMLPQHIQQQFAQNINTVGDNLEKYLAKEDEERRDFIDLAFTWDDTPEGHDYWSCLNAMFKDYEVNTEKLEKFYKAYPQHSKRDNVINNYSIY